MSTLTKEALAAMLNGREYGSEIIHAEEIMARDAGLVVVFGYSDDNMEIRGALGSDEFGCCDGETWKIGPNGILPDWDSIDHDDQAEVRAWMRKEVGATHEISAKWCPKEPKCSWLFTIDVPHATFNIVDDGELYCRGIVFALADLAPKANTPGDDAVMTGGES